MLEKDSLERQSKLVSYLYEMSEECMSEEKAQGMALKLKELYTKGFRHNYSEFFPLIVDIAKDDNKYDLDFLSNNLNMTRALVEKSYVNGSSEFKSLYAPLSKLSDHINLEIGRYSYYSLNEKKLQGLEKHSQTVYAELKETAQKLDDAKNELALTVKNLDDSKGALEDANAKVASVQTELITVLSIFAAIVFTFSGGINLMGSALTGIQNTPFFKATFFVLLCGFLVFNAIVLLLYIVAKLTDRNIYAKCKTKNCTCGENESPICNGVTRLRKRLPYVYWFNVVCLGAMIGDLLLWFLNIHFHFIPK